MRIDFHTHVFPDKLAEKALTSISEHTGAPYFTDGTVADTDKKLKEWNRLAQAWTKPILSLIFCSRLSIGTLCLFAFNLFL